MRTLLDGGTVTSPDGGHYAFRELHHLPDPIQRHVPILIGGIGRTKTLRTVARYADQWNGFGTPEALGELNGVLDGYLREEGRDPGAIERIANIWVVIRDDPRAAREVWAAQMAHNHDIVDEAAVALQRPILGGPRQVADRILEFVAAGLPSAIIELPAPYDAETIDRLIGEVKPLVEADWPA